MLLLLILGTPVALQPRNLHITCHLAPGTSVTLRDKHTPMETDSTVVYVCRRSLIVVFLGRKVR